MTLRKTRVRYSDETVRAVRAAEGTLHAIAAQYGVPWQWVDAVRHGRIRREATPFDGLLRAAA